METYADLNAHPRYAHVRPLSSGANGTVHLFNDRKTGEQVVRTQSAMHQRVGKLPQRTRQAIKLLERTERKNTYLEGELFNHRLLNYHPHVVQVGYLPA